MESTNGARRNTKKERAKQHANDEKILLICIKLDRLLNFDYVIELKAATTIKGKEPALNTRSHREINLFVEMHLVMDSKYF